MRRVALPLLVAALAVSPRASAQDPAAQARNEASAHYARGVRAYDEGDFTLALAEFERAQSIAPNFRTLYNIGQVDQQLRRYVRARAALTRFLAEGGDRIPAERRAEVERDLAMLATKVAHVHVTVDVAGAEVLVDDVRIGTAPLEREHEVDAGEHRIGARAKGHLPETQALTVAGGDDVKVDLHLTPDASPPPVVVAPVAPPREGENSRPPVWIGWTAAGTLAAGALVTGAFALSSASELDKLRRTPDSSPSERDGVTSRARAFAITTDVLAITALAAAGVSLYFTLRASAATAPSVGIGPRGVVFRGQF